MSEDGRRVATVQGQTTIVWDEHGRELERLEGVAPVLGPRGVVVTVAGTGSRLWQPNADGSAATVRVPGIDPRVSPDGQWVMTTVDGGRTRVADVSGHELTTLDGVSGQFSPIGPVVMTATAGGVVRVWDLRRVAVSTPEAAAAVWGLKDVTARDLMAADAAECAFECVSPDRTMRASVSMMGVTPGAPMTAALHLEVSDARVGSTGGDGEVPWRELPTATTSKCLGPMSALDFSPSAGHDVVFGCGDGIVRVFDKTGVMRWEGKHDGPVTRTAFSPDGQFVLTGSADRTARLWNATTGALITMLAGHESDVTSTIVSTDATHIATVTSRGVLRLWQRQGDGAAPLARITLDDDTITHAVFSADGSMVLARTRKSALRRWLTGSSQLEKEFDWSDALSSHSAASNP